MMLSLPDGSETNEWLKLRGINSPQFEKAASVADRELLELKQKDLDEHSQEHKEERKAITRKMLASLIAGWSFDQAATSEAVIDFLTGAPQIQRSVDEFAVQIRNFAADSFT